MEDLEELEAYKNYIETLQGNNAQLKEGLNEMRQRLTDSDAFYKNLSTQESVLLMDSELRLSKLTSDLVSLKDCCSKAQSFALGKDSHAKCLCHLPLYDHLAKKKKFDEYVKQFIINQFGNEMNDLFAQVEMAPCFQDNPHNLQHLISEQSKGKYQRQRQDLERLQESFSDILASSGIHRSTLHGLKTALKQIEKGDFDCSQQETRQRHNEVNQLECQVREVAKACIERKLELFVIGNMEAKRNRQKYYAERLNELKSLLKQKLALENFTSGTMQTEKSVLEKIIGNLGKINELFESDVEAAVNVVEQVDKVAMMSTPTDKGTFKLLELSNHPSLQHSAKELALKCLEVNQHQLHRLHSEYERLASATDMALLETPAWSCISDLEPKIQEFRDALSQLLAESNAELERLEEFPVVNLTRKLWAMFIARPEELSASFQALRQHLPAKQD